MTMSQTTPPSTLSTSPKPHDLEAQLYYTQKLRERYPSFYLDKPNEPLDDEDDDALNELISMYHELLGRAPFTDRRHDKRIVVKFYDVVYLTHDTDTTTDGTPLVEAYFDDFCRLQYERYEDFLKSTDIDPHYLITDYTAGHYQTFYQQIPDITEDNAMDLAWFLFDSQAYDSEDLHAHLAIVDFLQNMEDTYFEDWLSYLSDTDTSPNTIQTIRERYNKQYNITTDTNNTNANNNHNNNEE